MVSQQQIMLLLENPQVQQMVQDLLKQATGGRGPDVGQLLNQLTRSGLGGQAQSWVGTGENEPITGEQLQEALGTGTVTAIAEKVGIAPEAAANELANVVPSLVDSLSPHGDLPDAEVLDDQLTKIFGTQRS